MLRKNTFGTLEVKYLFKDASSSSLANAFHQTICVTFQLSLPHGSVFEDMLPVIHFPFLFKSLSLMVAAIGAIDA